MNNGHQINYGLGLWLGEYRGLRTVEHSGGTFGYRTELLRFPEQRFSVIALCNIANADVEGLARKISDLYLEKHLKSDASASASHGALPNPVTFAGTFLDSRTHMIYTFTNKNDDLMAWGATLRRLGPDEFSDLVGNPIVFKSANGTMTATLTLQGQTFFSGNRIPDIHLKESELRAFAGKYYSEELAATYQLSLDEGALNLKNGGREAVKLNPVTRNEFQAGDFGTLVFEIDRDKRFPDLVLFSQPARDIHFYRVD